MTKKLIVFLTVLALLVSMFAVCAFAADDQNETGVLSEETEKESQTVELAAEHKHCACGGLLASDKTHTCSEKTWVAVTDGADIASKASVNGAYYFYLENDVSVSAELKNNCQMYICLNGHKISGTSSGNNRPFGITNGKLTICDCSEEPGSVEGWANKGSGSAVLMRSGNSNSFFLYGGTLTGSGDNGIICVQNGNTANILGGTITGYSTATANGAIQVLAGGKLNISGGSFVDNSSKNFTSAGTVTVTGGSFDTDPTAFVPKEGYIISNSEGIYSVTEEPDLHEDHCICGDAEDVADEHSCTDVTSWIPVTDASQISATSGDAYYYLKRNLSLTSAISVNTSGSVTICLNGHSISSTARAFDVSKGTLNICDCSEDEVGTVKGGTATMQGAAIFLRADKGDAKLNLYSGTVTASTDGSASDSRGGIVMLNSNKCTVNLYGGKLTGNQKTKQNGGAIYNNLGTINVYGGEISGNSAARGGAVYQAGGLLNIFGGKICNNTSLNNAAVAIYGGKLNISGGEIFSNDTTAADCNGTITVTGANSEMTLSGGKIYNNTVANGNGGAIIIHDGAKVQMSGGSVYGNSAKTGGGIYCYKGSFTMSGGNLGCYQDDGGDWVASLNTPNNLLKGASGTISLSGGVFGQEETGYGRMTQKENGMWGFIEHQAHCDCGDGKCSAKDHTHNSSQEWKPISTPADLTAAIKNGGYYYLTCDIYQNNTNVDSGKDIHICLNGFKLSKAATSINVRVLNITNGTVTITDCFGNGEVVGGSAGSGSSGGSVQGQAINVEGANAKLNVFGGKISAQTVGNGIVAASKGATVNFYGGGITGNTGANSSTGFRKSDAAGIYVSNATFNMYGGSVYGNESKNGAIRVIDNGTFNLVGGTVCNNTSEGSAGAFYVGLNANVGTLNISGGEISDNKAANGGGVYIGGKGTVNMSAGSVANNTATGESAGAGILVAGNESAHGTLKMTGGEISNNKAPNAKSNGGGIYATYGEVNIENGLIFSNIAYEGGGIKAANSSKVTLKNATVSENTARGNGGGLVGSSGSVFSLTNCTVEKNKAVNGGGALMQGSSVMTVSGGCFEKNKTSNHGGAVYVSKTGELHATDCEFKDNQAKYGSAVYAQGAEDQTKATVVDLNNVTIDKNHAEEGSVYIGMKVDFDLHGGKITENNATVAGGGIRFKTADIELNKVEISKNTAPTGAGIYASDSDLTFNGITVSGNTATGNGGGVTLSDNTIMKLNNAKVTGNSANNGGGILLQLGCKAEISGGEVSGNTSKYTGGGVYCGGLNNALTVNGGDFSKNTAGSNGGALYFNKSTASVQNAKIHDNKAENEGAGIYAIGSKVNLESLTIEKNMATGNGGGIVAGQETVLSMTDGEKGTKILNNSAKNGGGLLVQSSAKAVITGCEFANNKATEGGGAIFISRNSKCDMTDGKIHHNSGKDGGAIQFLGCLAQMVDTEVYENTASNQGGGIYSKEATVTLKGIQARKNSAQAYGAAIVAGGKSNLAILKSEKQDTVVAENSAPLAGGICIQSQTQAKIYSADIFKNKTTKGGGPAIYCGSESNLELLGGTIHDNDATDSGGAINVSGSYATLNGGKIYNNHSAKDGGGVLANNGTLVINGCAITNNLADQNAGGVLVSTGSTCTIKKGSISGNKANNGGGIVSQSKGSKLFISGGTISNNSAVYAGGGLFVSRNTEFYMGGGTFTENHAETTGGGIHLLSCKAKFYGGNIIKNTCSDGGGVYCAGADAVLKNVNISENVASTSGGGVISGRESKVVIEEGTKINKNETRSGGGAVVQSMSEIVMNGGEICENIVRYSGGGVYVSKNASMTLNDGKINGNIGVLQAGDAPEGQNGGGVIVNDTFVMNGGEISDNFVAGTGGGIRVAWNSYCTINGGKISNNTAKVRGGALYTLSQYEIPIRNAILSDNSAGNYGGAIAIRTQSTISLENCEVSGNKAGISGGAVFGQTETRVSVTNSKITKNVSEKQYGAIYTDGNLIMRDTEITGNQAEQFAGIFLSSSQSDGHSYVPATLLMSGNMVIRDNGDNKTGNLHLDDKVGVVVAEEGLGDDAKVDVTLSSGSITTSVFGSYNYKGSNGSYTLTKGDKSITNAEPLSARIVNEKAQEAQAQIELNENADTAEETEETEVVESAGFPYWIVISAFGAAAILVCILVLRRKKLKKHAPKEKI